MSKPKVDIGVACSGSQTPDWWQGLVGSLLVEERSGVIEIGQTLAISSALPDHNKNNVISSGLDGGIAPAAEKRRNNLTDANRTVVVERFLDGKADYLFFLDDDTVHPAGSIAQLVMLQRDFVGGVYYNPRPPCNPIAYMRGDNGLYAPLEAWSYGALVQVDSIGMGCTLIHRSVFEKIMAEHKVFVRPNGSLAVVHASQVYGEFGTPNTSSRPPEYVMNGVLHTRVKPAPQNDSRKWPFFALEYGRTEDHHFCELAANVGIRPYLDTSINCTHIKTHGFTREDYRRENPALEAVEL